MTTFTELAEPGALEDPSVRNSMSGCPDESDADHPMRLLQQIAATLGVPLEAFFDGGTRNGVAEEASDQDIADLIDAFREVRDRSMRRYCIALVRAVGAGDSREPA